MTSLTSLISALEATWPPAGSRDVAGCRARTAPGAGSRVNSIRPLHYDLDDAAIATAEQEAIALAGAPLWPIGLSNVAMNASMRAFCFARQPARYSRRRRRAPMRAKAMRKNWASSPSAAHWRRWIVSGRPAASAPSVRP